MSRIDGLAQWQDVLGQLGMRTSTANRWAPAFADQIKPANFSLGWDEIDDFVAQFLHETGMGEKLEEDLYYRTPDRICAVWPSRFPTLDSARPFVENPRKLAEKVYGGRLGNTQPGDGYRYKGRGGLMVTGRTNYELVQTAIDEPVVDMPELLATPRVALKSGIAWWEKNIPDSVVGDVVRVSRRVNGGSTGLKHRIELAARASAIF